MKYIVATSDQFFRDIENSPELPTIRTESWMDVWTGSYESRVRGRQLSRKAECLMLAAETLSAMASHYMGFPNLETQLREAWYTLLINHHHDPQMAPMFEGLFPEVLRRYEDALWQIEHITARALGVMANHVHTDEQPGLPIIVFNTLGWQRDVVVEVPLQNVNCWLRPKASPQRPKGSLPKVVDATGKAIPVQLGEKHHDGQPINLTFLAERLPGCGWQTFYYQCDDQCPDEPVRVSASVDGIENEHVRIDMADGHIKSITLKDTGKELFSAAKGGGVNELFVWKDDGCICQVLPLRFAENAELKARSSEAKAETRVVENGPARAAVESVFTLDGSVFKQRITLAAGSHRIDFKTSVDYVPAEPEGRRIRVAFRPSENGAKAWRDVPFAVLPWEQTDVVRPLNSWFGMTLADDSQGAAILPKGMCSGHLYNDVMWLTLFRSVVMTEDCPWDWNVKGDQALEPGVNDYEYSLLLHEGTWENAAVPRAALEVNTPVFQHVAPRVARDVPKCVPGENTWIFVGPERLVMSACKEAEDGDGTIVRIYNPGDGNVSGSIRVACDSAAEVNFHEEHIADIATDGGGIALDFGPYEIKAVRLK